MRPLHDPGARKSGHQIGSADLHIEQAKNARRPHISVARHGCRKWQLWTRNMKSGIFELRAIEVDRQRPAAFSGVSQHTTEPRNRRSHHSNRTTNLPVRQGSATATAIRTGVGKWPKRRMVALGSWHARADIHVTLPNGSTRPKATVGVGPLKGKSNRCEPLNVPLLRVSDVARPSGLITWCCSANPWPTTRDRTIIRLE